MHTVLIVEDHPDTRQWLAGIVAEVFPETGQDLAATFYEAQEYLAAATYNLALIDLSLPDGNGLDLVVSLEANAPDTYVIVATIYDDDGHLFAALRAGAKGYLLKDQPRERLVEQLRGVTRGEPPLAPAVTRRILRHFSAVQRKATPAQELSEREVEVLRLLSRGFNRNDIAKAMDIKPNTAAGYIKAVYRKLNVSGKAEAVLEAVRLGIVDGTSN